MISVGSHEDYTKVRFKLLNQKEEIRGFFRTRYHGVRTEGYSKGPWNLDRDDQGQFYDSSHYGLCFEAGAGAGMHRISDYSRWHKNALLIEAAPVLFAELKNLVKSIESGSISEEDYLSAILAIKLARFDCEVEIKRQD